MAPVNFLVTGLWKADISELICNTNNDLHFVGYPKFYVSNYLGIKGRPDLTQVFSRVESFELDPLSYLPLYLRKYKSRNTI